MTYASGPQLDPPERPTSGDALLSLLDADTDKPNVQFPECGECGARPGQAHSPLCRKDTGK